MPARLENSFFALKQASNRAGSHASGVVFLPVKVARSYSKSRLSQSCYWVYAARSLAFRDAAFQAFTGLRPLTVIFTISSMRTSHVAGLVFLATAALAQQQQSVEITSEPSHHLVLKNEYVRAFDVTVAPKATTMIHRHHRDYVFVTLGDSDVTSARVGEKPAQLILKDGEVRFTPGGFAHAAINNSDQPFHNITIELLKPSSSIKACSGSCALRLGTGENTLGCRHP